MPRKYETPEERAEAQRRWRRESTKRARARDPERHRRAKAERNRRDRAAGKYAAQDRARRAVVRAISSGVLVPADRCADCGAPPPDGGRHEAHHDDYAAPLAVTWLCAARCHPARRRKPVAELAPGSLGLGSRRKRGAA